MLHDRRIVLGERNDVDKSNNSKEGVLCHYWFFNHGFKFQDSVCNGCLIWQCCVSILVILLLLLLKMMIITVVFMKLANLTQVIYQKMFCLMSVSIWKMLANEINIKNKLYSYYFDNLIKAKKLETKYFIDEKKYLDLTFCFTRCVHKTQ